LGKDTKITSQCIETSEGVYELGPASECYYFDGNDAIVLTKHFTIFYSFYDYTPSNVVQIIRHPSIRNKVIIIGSATALALGLGLYAFHKKRKREKNAQV